ncbi:hypothetical protein MU582_19040 [Nocardioidaceae bacterium SCSIO 66511]|nr:hypothetical protein MU582_19040 [Nocardioidaceae bacterium SCSIO 66511]
MNIDELVRESLNHGVDSLPKSEPEPVRVRARVRRRAKARIFLPAIAAAGVIAAVSVFAVDPFGSDAPVEPTVGTADDVATYITYPNRVHLDGHTYKAGHARGDTLEASTVTSAGFVYIGSDDFPYLIDRHGTEARIGESTNPNDSDKAWQSLAGSADHRYAAWASDTGGEFSVSLFDAELGDVVARRNIDCGSVVPDDGRCGYVTAVADGVVYLTANSKQGPLTVGWDPSLPSADQVYPVTEPGTQVTTTAAKTMLVAGKGDVYDHDGEPIGADWTVVPVKLYGSDLTSVVTADGRWRFTFSGKEETQSEDTLSAVNVHTGESVELAASVGNARIDDDGSVLVMTNGNGGKARRLMDCVLPSGKCSTVVDDLGQSSDFAGS